MVPTWRDAMVPAAAAVATSLPRRRGRALATLALLTGAQLTVDHLRRNETPTHVIGLRFYPGDMPGMGARVVPVVNSSVNGALFALLWLGPTALARQLPAAVGPTVNAGIMTAVRLASAEAADRLAARARSSGEAAHRMREQAARHPHIDDILSPS